MTQYVFRMAILVAALVWSGCQRENKAVNVAPKCDPKTDPKCTSDGNGIRPNPTSPPREEEKIPPAGGDSPGGGGGAIPPVDPNAPGGGATPPIDPNKPDPNKPDPNKPDPNKPDPSKPDPSKPDPSKPDPSKPDPSKPDPSTPDPNKPDSGKPDPNKPDEGKPNGGLTPENEGTVKDLGVKGSLSADGLINLKLDEPNKAKFSEFSVETSGSLVPFNGPPTSNQSVVIGSLNIDLHFKFKFEKSDCSARASLSPGVSESTSTPSLTAIETRCK